MKQRKTYMLIEVITGSGNASRVPSAKCVYLEHAHKDDLIGQW